MSKTWNTYAIRRNPLVLRTPIFTPARVHEYKNGLAFYIEVVDIAGRWGCEGPELVKNV